jgi:hypothetical protein
MVLSYWHVLCGGPLSIHQNERPLTIYPNTTLLRDVNFDTSDDHFLAWKLFFYDMINKFCLTISLKYFVLILFDNIIKIFCFNIVTYQIFF